MKLIIITRLKIVGHETLEGLLFRSNKQKCGMRQGFYYIILIIHHYGTFVLKTLWGGGLQGLQKENPGILNFTFGGGCCYALELTLCFQREHLSSCLLLWLGTIKVQASLLRARRHLKNSGGGCMLCLVPHQSHQNISSSLSSHAWEQT